MSHSEGRTLINASHWHYDTHHPFEIYSPDTDIIQRIKKYLSQHPSFHQIESLFKALYQAFACLIVDTRSGELLLARDHFGLEPFYYSLIATTSTQLCFASNLPDILQHIKNPTLDMSQVKNILSDICISSLEYTDHTFYKNIFRITPGHIKRLQLQPKINERSSAFWTLDPHAPLIHYASDAKYDEQFAALMHESIQTCIKQSVPHPIGLEFSGGLDSSTILTTLDTANVPTHLFMHTGERMEERHYGEHLQDLLKLKHPLHLINADDFDILKVLNQCRTWFAGAAPYLFFMFAHNIHQAVNTQGCKILLSGFGGDECVSDHAPLHSYPLPLKNLWQELKNTAHLKKFLQLVKLKNPRLRRTLQYIKLFNNAIARKQKQVFYKRYHSLQEKQWDWLQGPFSHHVRMRIEYSAVVARSMGFAYRYPLLYPPLVEFCFALPTEQKRRQGNNRLLARRYLEKSLSANLFNAHKKCGDIFPATLAKTQALYSSGQLHSSFATLPFSALCDEIQQRKLLTPDRKFHLDILRYMFKDVCEVN